MCSSLIEEGRSKPRMEQGPSLSVHASAFITGSHSILGALLCVDFREVPPRNRNRDPRGTEPAEIRVLGT